MGRRSLHTLEQLKELFISTTLAIVEQDGVAGLSARTIARKVGYSPGTLYNVFENLDALIFHVEVRVLDDLGTRLLDAQTGAEPRERLLRVAETYLAFAEERPLAWSLLFEHHVGSPIKVPTAYTERLELIVKVIEHAVRAQDVAMEAETAQAMSRLIFCALNGIAALATSAKLAKIGSSTARALMRDLVELAGAARPELPVGGSGAKTGPAARP